MATYLVYVCETISINIQYGIVPVCSWNRYRYLMYMQQDYLFSCARCRYRYRYLAILPKYRYLCFLISMDSDTRYLIMVFSIKQLFLLITGRPINNADFYLYIMILLESPPPPCIHHHQVVTFLSSHHRVVRTFRCFNAAGSFKGMPQI